MSDRKDNARPAQGTEGGQGFAFGKDDRKAVAAILKRYPKARKESAALPLLTLAQERCGGHLGRGAIEEVARILELAPIRLYELATFYAMYHLKPVGRYRIGLCRSISCWLKGGDALLASCRETLGIASGGVTGDGLFSLHEVECLGACVNAPVVAVNADYYEDMTPATMKALLDAARREALPPAGPMSARRAAEPEGGPTTLTTRPELAAVAPLAVCGGKGRRAAGKKNAPAPARAAPAKAAPAKAAPAKAAPARAAPARAVATAGRVARA